MLLEQPTSAKPSTGTYGSGSPRVSGGWVDPALSHIADVAERVQSEAALVGSKISWCNDLVSHRCPAEGAISVSVGGEARW